MSTKIYEAYKVKDNLTMPEVMSYLKKFKGAYLDKAHEFLMGCDKDKIKENYGSDAFKLHDTLKERASRPTNDVFNWTASAVVYFHQDNIYIQFFGVSFRMDIEELFDGHLQDYHYQNQTDEWWHYDDEEYTPEQLAEFKEDWETRKQVWDDIFNEEWVPAKCGLVYEIYDKNDTFDVSIRYFRAIGEL